MYAHDVSSSIFSSSAIIDDKFSYGLSIDPENGNIYGLEAPPFTDQGNIHMYNSQGNKMITYQVGVGPNSVLF